MLHNDISLQTIYDAMNVYKLRFKVSTEKQKYSVPQLFQHSLTNSLEHHVSTKWPVSLGTGSDTDGEHEHDVFLLMARVCRLFPHTQPMPLGCTPLVRHNKSFQIRHQPSSENPATPPTTIIIPPLCGSNLPNFWEYFLTIFPQTTASAQPYSSDIMCDLLSGGRSTASLLN